MKRLLVLDTDIQRALAGLVAWFQLGIDALDASILLKDLQLLLQRFKPHRGLAPEFDAVPQIAGPEPAVSVDVNVRESTFNDVNGCVSRSP